jgi:hypothetical protein
LGTSPIQAARLRPDENTFQSPTSATRAVATIGAHASNFLEPPTFLARSVPGMDMLLKGSDLCRGVSVLPNKSVEAQSRNRWNTVIIRISNDLQQLGRALAALGRDDVELCRVPADRIR